MHLAVGTYWSKTINKGNAPGRIFSFSLIRTMDPLSMQRILLWFIIMISISLYISKQLPCDLRVELSLFSRFTQPKAESPVPRSWLGRCHSFLAGIKHLYFSFCLPQDWILSCISAWLLPSLQSHKYVHSVIDLLRPAKAKHRFWWWCILHPF